MDKVVIETVNKLFIATDNKDWDSVASIFSDTVLYDHTSISGGLPANLTSPPVKLLNRGRKYCLDLRVHIINSGII